MKEFPAFYSAEYVNDKEWDVIFFDGQHKLQVATFPEKFMAMDFSYMMNVGKDGRRYKEVKNNGGGKYG